MAALDARSGSEKSTGIPRGDRIVLGCLLVFLAAFAGFYVVDYFGSHDPAGGGTDAWLGGDFFVYWSTARFIFEGHVASLYDVTALTEYQLAFIHREELFYPWPYPPHGLFFVLPFGHMPYMVGYFLWSVATFLFYAWAGTGGRPSLPRLGVLLVAPATLINFLAGQNGFLTAGLLMGGMLLVDRRPWLAGILFGLLTFKPHMGVLIPVALIAAGLWRPFIAAAVSGLVLMGLATVLFGAQLWVDYLDFIPVFQEKLLNAPDLFIALSPSVFMAAKIFGSGVTMAYAMQAAVALMTIAVIAYIYRHGTDRRMQAAALAVGALLITPYAFNYDMTLVSLAVMLAAERGFAKGFLTGERLVLVLAWVLPVSLMQLNPLGLPLAPAGLLIAFLYMAVHALGWADGPASKHHITSEAAA